MTHRSLSLLIAFSIALTPALRADSTSVQALGIEINQSVASAPEPLPDDPDDSFGIQPEELPGQAASTPSSAESSETTLSATPTEGEDVEEEGSTVSQGSDSQRRAAKRKQLRNIGIAFCAVAVAVVAMILVSTNNGHKSN